ncbi:MAG: type III secretion system stator protein SctL [Geminicoccaceae bacterium]
MMETAAAERDHDEVKGGEDLRFRPRGRVIRASEIDAWNTGCSFLEAAKREAKRIRKEAVKEFDEEKRRGFEEGRKEGVEAAARILAETKARADRSLAEADGQLVDLAMAIVQRVLGNLDARQLILKAVDHALTKQRQDRSIVIYASPEIVDQLRLQINESFDDSVRHLMTVEGDPKLDVGDCRMATDVGFVELGVDAQLRALHQGLRENLRRPGND